MPLHVARLRDSDMANEGRPEGCWYAVLLWSASWHQLPAGSLPDNEAVLTKLCGLGRDVRTFRKFKADALRGFVLCSDGRLYHPVVAEQAVAAWESKLQQRWRTECARIKKANQRTGSDQPTPTFDEFMGSLSPASEAPSPADVPKDVPEDNADCPEGQSVQETETGTERLYSVPDGTGAEAPSDDEVLIECRAKGPSAGAWELARRVLMLRGSVARSKTGDLIGKWRRDFGLSDEELWETAEAAWRNGTQEPVAFMTKVAAGIQSRRGSAQIDAPSERQQRSWMEDWRDKGAPGWRRHERGPYPGEEGCRVSPELQREFGVEPFSADLVPMGRFVA